MVSLESPPVALLLTLLITVAVVAALVRYIRIPYSVALVVVGIALALLPDTPMLSLTPGVILTVFLPVLLFYGAYHLDLTDLRANLTPVALLAVPGVVATAGLVGLALHWAAGLAWTDSFLFGTIVAATDPVAVLTLFGELGAPRRLTVIVTGESLFNDGTALVFFSVVLGVATTTSTTGVDLGATAEQFAIAVLGALALGAAVGLLGTAVLARIDDALVETVITLIMAYGGYLLADRLGASGPIETVTAGIFLGVGGKTAMSATTRLQSGATWEFLDFLFNSVLFLLVGLAIGNAVTAALAEFGSSLWVPLVVAIVAVTLARAVVIWAVGLVLAALRRPLPRWWQLVLTWSGLRGAVALAAALSLPTSLASRDLLLTLTFGVVVFTILAQGLSIGPLLRWLGVVNKGKGRHVLDLALGRLAVIQAAIRDLAAMREVAAIDERVAERLLQRYLQRRDAVRAQVDAAYQADTTLERDQEQLALQHLAHVEHAAAREVYARGQVDSEVYRDLVGDIDEELSRLGVSLAQEERSATETDPA